MALEALRRAGFGRVHPVPEQLEPDPAFPTVRFPNPEEPGAMDLSRALAERTGAELVLANDPDADRLAVLSREASGQLRALTGNEVGVLLGHYLLVQGPRRERPLVRRHAEGSDKNAAPSCVFDLDRVRWSVNGTRPCGFFWLI